MAAALNCLEKAKHPAVARDHPLSAVFPEAHENFVEERVLEFLRHQCALDAEEIRSDRDPFEVAVMETGENDPLPRFHRLLNDLEIHDVDVARIIFLRQARTPEKIDHCPGEMQIGFARQPGPLCR